MSSRRQLLGEMRQALLGEDREAALAALPHLRAYAAAHGLSRECPRAYTAMFLAHLAQKEETRCETPPSPRT